ncbi:hypothetical protein Rsub_02254 [Raphidocelis subcapitata]|uniref:Uncharacterized protein n=1 Tax=Raphidocelis subcapitata TaxID=307507 RepID=A0A2V0NPK4_9CHLO|nr:hypothetical protein Rsub_02254 [Raphidocelis subcapitata]|eukprot:GBF89536.1 hypothetical protein Rsub_02254 [Raphidocelis subcapitata]
MSEPSPWSVPLLVWDVLKSHLPAAERDEVARVVGRDLIRANAEAHQEACALAELLEGVADDSTRELQRRALCSSQQRRMLESQVLLLLEQLAPYSPPAAAATSPAAGDGYSAATLPVRRLPSREAGVAAYVAAASQAPPSSRPSTASSRPSSTASWGSWERSSGSATGGRPLRAGSCCASAGAAPDCGPQSVYTAAPPPDPLAVLALLPRPLSVWSADGVCGRLRDALAREAAALAAAVARLRGALEEEADRCSAARMPPPSVADLQATVDALHAAAGEQAAAAQRRPQPEAPCACAAAAGPPRPALPPPVPAGRPLAKPRPPAPQPCDSQQASEAEGCGRGPRRQRLLAAQPVMSGRQERGPSTAVAAPPSPPPAAHRCGRLPAVQGASGQRSEKPAGCALPPLQAARAASQGSRAAAVLGGGAAISGAGRPGAR